MRVVLLGVLALGMVGLAGCQRLGPAPVAAPKYVVGQAWQGDRAWFYPRENYDYRDSGLASVAADGRPRLTANGEVFDQGALAAGHQTLQMPAVLIVTNLDNGLRIRVRVNDRGPSSPGRVIELTRRAAELLRIPANGTAAVRLEIDGAMSRAVAEKLGEGVRNTGIDAAPRASVKAEALAGRQIGAPAQSVAAGGRLPDVADRLPEMVEQGPAGFRGFFMQAGEFSRFDYAYQRVAALYGTGARVERRRVGKSEEFAVVAGPFNNSAQADAALDLALRAGVVDARITAE